MLMASASGREVIERRYRAEGLLFLNLTTMSVVALVKTVGSSGL
jgi:hypothetical protein